MPLVINFLWVDTQAHTHKIYQSANQNNFKKPGMRWPQAGTHLV